MRTKDEFLTEARRVEAIGELYADEHRRATLLGRNLQTRNIPTFLGPLTPPRDRWLETEVVDGALEYRLVEIFDVKRETEPAVLFASDSAFDLLVEADELEEKEKLGEALAPILERIERHEFDESVEPAIVEEVEALIEGGDLDPAARLKTKAEIVEFLAGRMEPTVFAAHIVERRTERATLNESLTHRCDEQRILEQL